MSRLHFDGVTGFFGYGGSGKTLAMVEGCQQAQADGCLIATNFGFKTQDIEVYTFDDWIALCRWQMNQEEEDRQRLHIAIDEMGMLLSARNWQKWPDALDVFFQQYRHFECSLAYTAPHFDLIDVNVRRVTSRVINCRGFWPKRIKGEQRLTTRPRVFSRAMYHGFEYGKVQARPKRSFSFFKSKVGDAYDTKFLVHAVRRVLDEDLAKPRPDIVVLPRLTD